MFGGALYNMIRNYQVYKYKLHWRDPHIIHLNTIVYSRDLSKVPCSEEHSGEGSVISSEFSVPLFKGENCLCSSLFHI